MSDVYRVTLDFGEFDAESPSEAREAALDTIFELPDEMAAEMEVTLIEDTDA